MTIIKVKIEDIKNNPNNPRIIKDDKFKKLVNSIKGLPQMLDIRPIVVDENMIVLGGNMRLKACKEAGLKEVPIIKASQLTEEQKKEFILRDNQSYGEWDIKLLSTWDKDILLDSGFEDFELIDIYGTNDMVPGLKKELEGSNFNKDVVNVDDYIKQNILFFNELMIEFEDDNIKKSLKNINDLEGFTSDCYKDKQTRIKR